jgi:hypothetical protein
MRWQNKDMDGNAPLTDTTLSRSLTALHAILSGALEKGAKIKASQKEGFLMDVAFSVALVAGWIDAPETPLAAELQYILTPEAREKYRQTGPVATVTVGGFEVPETFYDEFVSLFWHKNPTWISETNAAIIASVEATLSDPNFDPLADLRNPPSLPIVENTSTDSHVATPASEPQPTTTTKPALLLVDAKKELGVTSWEQFCLMASKHLKELQAQQQQEGIIAPRASWQLTRDDIFRLQRGENIRVIKVKAIARFLNAELVNSPLRPPGGWSFKHFIWPKEARRRGRPPKQ